MRTPAACLVLALSASCASAPAPAPVAPPPPPAAVTARRAPPAVDANGCPTSGGLVIEGGLGTLPQGVVNRVVGEGTENIARCFVERHQTMPYLSGRIELKLRVGTDGAVRWAVPLISTLGDRETERCMTERARALHFTPPCGGEAEVTFPLEMEGGGDARPATVWPNGRLDAAMREHRTAVGACRQQASGPMSVTVYVSPDGRVSTMGASAPTEQSVAAVECLAHEMASWRVPTPGSWFARTTVQIP